MRFTGLTGLEPATSSVTGRCSNQLNYNPILKRMKNAFFSSAKRILFFFKKKCTLHQYVDADRFFFPKDTLPFFYKCTSLRFLFFYEKKCVAQSFFQRKKVEKMCTEKKREKRKKSICILSPKKDLLDFDVEKKGSSQSTKRC